MSCDSFSEGEIRKVIAEVADVIACPATRAELLNDPFLGGEVMQALAMMVISERMVSGRLVVACEETWHALTVRGKLPQDARLKCCALMAMAVYEATGANLPGKPLATQT